jgi:hypothetical protein
MTDFFDIEAHPPCLMNISTGMYATREVQDSLLSAVNEGEKKCRKFVNSALSVGQEGGPLYQRSQSWFRSNGLLLLGLVPHLCSKLFASFFM